MTTTMMRTTEQPRSLNPSWLPQRIPTWMTITRANALFGYRDNKGIADRAKKLGVTRRQHPYDKRKRQLYMPELLSRMDFDISTIEFTSGVDYVKPK